MENFQSEFPFELSKGYLDGNGILHKKGVMRLATAADEILPMKDPRVQQNPGYLSIILLSRVVTSLGDIPAVDTRVIEKLFTIDLAFLQDMYQRINQSDSPIIHTVCPCCGEEVEIAWPFLGE